MKLSGIYFLHPSATPYKRISVVYTIAMIILCCSVMPAAFAHPFGNLPGQNNAGIFRAAVVKIDITPDQPKMLLGYNARQSTGVHDRIYHRIVILNDGTTEFCLVSSDICVISPSEYDHLASLLYQQLGIAPENFWWTLTHTHSAPEVGLPGLPEVFMGERYKHPVDTAYTHFVEQKIIEGIKQARKQLVKAKLGVGWGHSNANMNRRAIDVNGKAGLGMNPDGAIDKKIGLIRIDKEDGTPLALISNYAIHGTALGAPNLKISGDVPGIVSEYVEEKLGVPMLFINGAAGNIAPIYSTYPNPGAAHLSQFRVLLGDKILEANKRIAATTGKVQLFTGKFIIETPRKADLGWPSDLGSYTRNIGDGKNVVRLPVGFLKINHDIAIWSLPVELFCEISNEIRDKSPYPYTFYYGYTNGWLGYLPTADEFKYGGYEVETVSPYTTEAEADVIEGVMNYLQGELRTKISADRVSVNRPSLIVPGVTGVLELTAEKGKGIGPDIKYMPEWKAFGWFRNKDRIEWEIAPREEKEYAVILEWSVSNEDAGKSFILESSKDRIIGEVGKSGSWETFASEKIGVMKLKPGKQKIIFKPYKDFDPKQALLDVRKIILVPVGQK
ncbi:neutral/alkaline non-lysosomal ceramidase N-terminal domain-containing protein [Agriterribacter sp.]|uniref:neutral/alkaline non-lysosomal ceramidase N-terminal domain-containing protein n=1 Tax=Agriterribacter sp. TaxID=2821509 RepID=UPI002C958147|nr:neutral/alkaline non-lysosomal ceramidase N-terminal domain-containing protein [Agriterribacter sp.]HTN07765.1 neutral/alkaline non-lysosomal ceramidase N-terminal domain-containing protein [Agriterribacter sp.]